MKRCLKPSGFIELLFPLFSCINAHTCLRFNFLLLVFVFSFSALSAQQVFISSGGSAFGSGGSVSYSVGQLFYKLQVETSVPFTGDVQQSQEKAVVTGIPEAPGIDIFILAYPNPAKDLLYLKVEGESLNKMSYQIYDVKGKLLENKEIYNRITNIALDSYVSSTYFIKVLQDRREIKIFRIIKN